MTTSSPLVKPLAATGVALLLLPLVGLVVSAPWSQLPQALAQPGVGSAIGLSLLTSLLATAVVGLVGVPLGWVIARSHGWAWVRPLCLVPLVVPPVVVGVALQHWWGPPGLLGRALGVVGIEVPGSVVAVLLAQVFVALPFCVLAVESAVRRVDPRAEEVAQVYGLDGADVLRRVTLPLARPGVVAGLSLAFARALGEFGATLTFAGDVAGRTRTMPLAIAAQVQQDPAVAAALSLILLLVSGGVLVRLRGRLGLTT